MQNVTLKVQGMSCGHCVKTVETAVKEIGAAGKVDLAAKTVVVKYDETQISLDQIKEAIKDQGYEVE